MTLAFQSVKFIQIMGFFACWFHTAMCVSFSLILPVMMETSEEFIGNTECNRTYEKAGPTVAWTQVHQGYVLAGYGLGYFLAQLASAPAVNVLGARWVVLAATVLGGAATLLLPFVALISWIAALFMRFLCGFAGGVICDSIFTLIENWVPPGNFFNFFFIAGVALVAGVSGTWLLLGALMPLLGWPLLLYVLGGAALAWVVLWVACVRDSPAVEHDLLAHEEELFTDYLPLSVLFSSCPYISLIVLYYGDLFGLAFFVLLLPKFVYEVLGLSVFLTGLVCSVALLCRFVSSFGLELVVKCIIKYDCLDLTSVRKMFVFFSHVFTGVAVMTWGFIGCHAGWLVAALCVGLAMSGASSVTSHANARDLSPSFVRTLFVVMHFIALTGTFLQPNFMGLMLTAQGDVGWRHLLFVVMAVYLVSALVFLIFGSGDVQPWNFPNLYLVAHASQMGKPEGPGQASRSGSAAQPQYSRGGRPQVDKGRPGARSVRFGGGSQLLRTLPNADKTTDA